MKSLGGRTGRGLTDSQVRGEREGRPGLVDGGQGGAFKQKAEGVSWVPLSVTRCHSGRTRRGTYGWVPLTHGAPGHQRGMLKIYITIC